MIDLLKQFPEVEWDRYSGTPDDYVAFGWIKRKDGQRDFCTLEVLNGFVTGIVTSSAKYSAVFADRLGYDHTPCTKIEGLS